MDKMSKLLLYIPFFFLPLLATEFLRISVGPLTLPIFNLLILVVLVLNFIRNKNSFSMAFSAVEKQFLIWFSLFTFACMASMFMSENASDAISFVLKLFYIFVFFFYLKSFNNLTSENIRTVIKVVAIVSSFLMCLIMYQYIIVFNVYYIALSFAEATESGKNQLALYIVVVTSLIFWLYISEKKWISLYLPALLIHLAALILTFSKAALLIFTVTTIFCFARSMRRNHYIRDKHIQIKKFLAFSFVTFVGFVILLGTEGFRQEFLSNLNWILDTQNVVEDTSTSLRKYYIERSLEHFYMNPILGIGITNFAYFNPDETHNSYLQILAELGIIGFVCYSVLMTLIVKHALLYKPQNGFEIGIAQAVYSAILYLLFINAINTLIVFIPCLLLTVYFHNRNRVGYD